MGFAMVQLSASLVSSIGSEPGFAITIPSICFASTEISFGAGGVFDAAGALGCLLVHHKRPPSTTRTPSAVKSPPNLMVALSPLPPDRNARDDHDQWEKNHACQEEDANGGTGDAKPPVFWFLRADG